MNSQGCIENPKIPCDLCKTEVKGLSVSLPSDIHPFNKEYKYTHLPCALKASGINIIDSCNNYNLYTDSMVSQIIKDLEKNKNMECMGIQRKNKLKYQKELEKANTIILLSGGVMGLIGYGLGKLVKTLPK